MSTIGIDIGGANLKAVFLADTDVGDSSKMFAAERAIEVSFPMWQKWKELPSAIGRLLLEIAEGEEIGQVAVTMTGELADCFATKQEGVAFIADAVDQAVNQVFNRTAKAKAIAKPPAFYMTDGNWCNADCAELNWQRVAASNWHAMASFAARLLPNQTGLMIDVGSTTTDLIPVVDGWPCSRGLTDLTRLQHGELIYAGIGRTPICGLIQEINVPAGRLPLAREMFATVDDALIWRGLGVEDTQCCDTADGRPRTRVDAGRRLAKMLCSDSDEAGVLVDAIAEATCRRIETLIVEGVERQVEATPVCGDAFLIVGAGDQLVTGIVRSKFPQAQCIRLSEIASRAGSVCGPALAVAVLLQERI